MKREKYSIIYEEGVKVGIFGIFEIKFGSKHFPFLTGEADLNGANLGRIEPNVSHWTNND